MPRRRATDSRRTPATSGVNDAGLAEAVSRDLGLTPEEFNGAGELGRQAAAAAEALRSVPGYTGTRLQDGRILVSGSGPELEARVAELAATTPSLTLEPPAPEAAGGTPAPRNRAGHKHPAALPGLRPEVRPGPAGRGLRRREICHPNRRHQCRRIDHGGTVTGQGSPAAAAGKVSAEDFVARFANVKLDAGTDLAPEADLVGAKGYFADTGEIVLHRVLSRSTPPACRRSSPPGTAPTTAPRSRPAWNFPAWTPAGPLGTFGFSQFGGPGNTGIVGDEDNPGNVGTDVAVIGSIAAGLEPQPAASTWNDPSEAGPDVKIIGTAAPVEGQPVCRSGRTSAWSCGTIDEVGIYVVQGRSGNPADLRAFSGFLSFAVQSSGGDSGGPWLSGNYAVGIHAAGEGAGAPVNFAVAATLEDALAVLPGYQLELFLNKPAVTSPAPGGTYEPGQTITGNVPAAPASAVAAGSTVRITACRAGARPRCPWTMRGTGSSRPPKPCPVLLPERSASPPRLSTASAPPGPAPSNSRRRERRRRSRSLQSPNRCRTRSLQRVSPIRSRRRQRPRPPSLPARSPRQAPRPSSNPLLPTWRTETRRTPASRTPAPTGVLTAAGAALAAIAVGGVLMVLVRRRKKRRTPWMR